MPSKYHNPSNEALADEIGRAEAIVKAAEAELKALKDEFKARVLTHAAGEYYVSSVCCRRPDRACCGHAQLDDRVGCSALFLGSRRLSRLVRSRGLSAALPCMERGARDHLGPSVAGLRHDSTIGTEACSGFHWCSPARDRSQRVFRLLITCMGRPLSSDRSLRTSLVHCSLPLRLR
jgi:hypothetical protein